MDEVLVTGIGSYVGLHVAKALLDDGYAVRGTVRDLSREGELRASLAVGPERLKFVRAELLAEAGWAEAVQGCRFVMHVASPVPHGKTRHEDELIRPALEGTERVLRAAAAAKVERLVVTSSVAAVASAHPRSRSTPFTETDWSHADSSHIDPYARSKTLAERRAWDVARETGLSLVAINPSYVFGPLLARHTSPSLLWIEKVLRREVPGVADLYVPCVDVREVARAHVTAVRAGGAVGERFVLSGHEPHHADIAKILVEAYPRARLSARRLPDWMVRLVGVFDRSVRLVVPGLGHKLSLDHAKATRLLGFQPRSLRDTVLDTAASLQQHGFVSLRA